MNTILGGAQTALGAGATALGAPSIGLPLTASGVGTLSGTGGTTGGMGFAQPGTQGTPSLASMAGGLPSFIDPSQIAGISTAQAAAPSGGEASALLGGGSPLSGLGSIGQQYMNYVLQSKLNRKEWTPPRAPAFSSSGGVMTGQLGIPQAAFPQLPQIG